jgi:hypothetical protein
MVNSNNNPITLSQADTKLVTDFLAELSEASQHRQSLNRLISRWKNFSASVAKGYNDTIYDYENDLSIRDILDKIMEKLSESGKNEVAMHIEHADKSFVSSTRSIALPSHKIYDEDKWWQSRVPLYLSDELKQEFIDAGYRL